MQYGGKTIRMSEAAIQGRLQARPLPGQWVAHGSAWPTGLQTLENGALLYVPVGYQADHPAPLILLLHGAGGNAKNGLNLLRDFADTAGLILLAPRSRTHTWDVIVDQYGPDIALIDEALTQTFEHYAIAEAHIAIAGFSDGGSYALSAGLTNGDLFTHIIAFSPGFMAPASRSGLPQIYIAHGVTDTVLPIERCSRRIVPQLMRAGYTVRYHEFDGPHTLPAKIADEAINWFTAS
ncbi:MAG: alpha/beta hydrolase-fold protein [Chloroflexi bacterium]|nr:alpha/beta hydrolase-fold protein [Chloroflexota bacterium]